MVTRLAMATLGAWATLSLKTLRSCPPAHVTPPLLRGRQVSRAACPRHHSDTFADVGWQALGGDSRCSQYLVPQHLGG